jgi:hypothetical protein
MDRYFFNMDWFGLYGAVLATVLAVIQLRRYRRESRGLRVRAHPPQPLMLGVAKPGSFVVYDSDALQVGPDEDGAGVALRVINDRDKAIAVESAGAVLKNGDRCSTRDDCVRFPSQLESGQPPLVVEFRSSDFKIHDVAYLAVWDATGRAWRVPRWNLFALKLQAGALNLPIPDGLRRRFVAFAIRRAQRTM